MFDEFVKTGMIAPEIFDVIKRKKLTHQLIYADSANLETIEQIKRLGARKIKPVKKVVTQSFMESSIYKDIPSMFIHAVRTLLKSLRTTNGNLLKARTITRTFLSKMDSTTVWTP